MPEEVIATQETDPLVLISFLHNCMKLLRDHKVLKGLQDLIENYDSNGNLLPK